MNNESIFFTLLSFAYGAHVFKSLALVRLFASFDYTSTREGVVASTSPIFFCSITTPLRCRLKPCVMMVWRIFPFGMCI